jgi:hypothetical protein
VTLNEIKEKIHTFTDDERKKYLNALWDLFCPISQKELLGFQERWIPGTFEEFKEKQNEMFIKLIEIETSDIGRMVRKDLSLKEINLETEI